MIISIKDALKLIGVMIIIGTAAFVSYIFLNYLLDVKAIYPTIPKDNAEALSLYNAQISMAKMVCAITGSVLTLIAVVATIFYVKLYIDSHIKTLGILKANGYGERSLALVFGVFSLPVFIGSLCGCLLSSTVIPTVFKAMCGNLLPTIKHNFHPTLLMCIVMIPTALFFVICCLYAYCALKKPVLSMLRGDKKIKLRFYKDDNKLPFVKGMSKATIKSKLSLAFFMGLSGFCFSAMTQMSFSMKDLSVSGVMTGIIFACGIVLSVTVFIMAVTSLINANQKSISLMKAFGYNFEECAKSVLGGYRPIVYIGFALGTLYQFLLLYFMVNFVFSDVKGITTYSFDVVVFFLCLAVFAVIYETATLLYSKKLNKISLGEIMLD